MGSEGKEGFGYIVLVLGGMLWDCTWFLFIVGKSTTASHTGPKSCQKPYSSPPSIAITLLCHLQRKTSSHLLLHPPYTYLC